MSQHTRPDDSIIEGDDVHGHVTLRDEVPAPSRLLRTTETTPTVAHTDVEGHLLGSPAGGEAATGDGEDDVSGHVIRSDQQSGPPFLDGRRAAHHAVPRPGPRFGTLCSVTPLTRRPAPRP